MPLPTLRYVSEGYSALMLAICLERFDCARCLIPACGGLYPTHRFPASAVLASRFSSFSTQQAEWTQLAAELAAVETERGLLASYKSLSLSDRERPSALMLAAKSNVTALLPLLAQTQARYQDRHDWYATDYALFSGYPVQAALAADEAVASAAFSLVAVLHALALPNGRPLALTMFRRLGMASGAVPVSALRHIQALPVKYWDKLVPLASEAYGVSARSVLRLLKRPLTTNSH
jgi:hypothetical protein